MASTAGVPFSRSAKNASTGKPHSLSEALRHLGREDSITQDSTQLTATFQARNTRFTRQASSQAQATPERVQYAPTGGNNLTAQSNSLLLPNLPNVTELVSGVRKDGTPVFNKEHKPRSRFTAGPGKSARPGHNIVDDVSVAEEEKVIYASLQLLKDRVEQLEMEKSEAQKRTEEYEYEITELRTQLRWDQHGRPDSALGSEVDFDGMEKWKGEKTSLQASIQTLQDRLDRSDRKLSVSDISVKRITKERDELATQMGQAYLTLDELKVENSELKDNNMYLQTEYEELKDQMETLMKENQGLRQLMSDKQTTQDDDTFQREKKRQDLISRLGKMVQNQKQNIYVSNASNSMASAKDMSQVLPEQVIKSRKEANLAVPSARDQRQTRNMTRSTVSTKDRSQVVPELPIRSRKEGNSDIHHPRAKRPQSADEDKNARLASLIYKEAQQHRYPTGTTTSRTQSRTLSASRQESTGMEHKANLPSFTVSAPTETGDSDAESTTQLHLPEHASNVLKRGVTPTTTHAQVATLFDDTKNLTKLSYQDPDDVDELRSKLEDDLMDSRMSPDWQSSMKEFPQTHGNNIGRSTSAASEQPEDLSRVTKSIDTGDASMTSNTSRRRRRAESNEGLTSAFIVPDITLNSSNAKAEARDMSAVTHSDRNCTSCASSGEHVEIPAPIPVTDREDVDVTNATIRPSQPPTVALATVIKQLEDEISHLKIKLHAQQRLYNRHDAAISKRRRQDIKIMMNNYTAEVEKRSDQVYALYDVLEGQKQAAELAQKRDYRQRSVDIMEQEDVENTLASVGMDTGEITGRLARIPVAANSADYDADGPSGDTTEEIHTEDMY